MSNFKFFRLANFFKNNSETIKLFNFSFNSKKFSLLCKTYETALVFGKIGTVESFILPISSDFKTPLFLEREKFKELCHFFELKYDPNVKVKPFDIFKTIDGLLTEKLLPEDTPRKEIVRAYQLEEPENIYFGGFIHWKTRHVSEENRNKTKLLLPEVYEQIKNLNVSVRFIAIKKDIETELYEINEQLATLK